MSMHRLSGCPSCAEPLEEGDRFCGLCGYALTAADPTGPAAPSTAATDQAAAEAASAPARAAAPAAVVAPAPAAPAAPAPAAAAAAAAVAPPPAAVPATRSAAAAEDGLVSRPSGATTHGRYGGPAAAGYAGEPAPGWGSVSTAAPTLVEGPVGWSDTAAAPDPHGSPLRPEAPYGAASHPGQGPADGAPYGAAAAQDPGPAAEPGYGLAAPQGQTSAGEAPYEGTPPQGGPDTSYDIAAPQGAAHWNTGPQGTGSGGEAHQDSPAPQGQTPGGEARYDSPAPQGQAQTPGGEAPYGSTAPQGEGAGKTCVACRAGRVDTDGYCEHCGHAQPRERDHLEEELGSVAAVSDRGLRHHRNEDSFAVAATALPDGSAATVAIVCDGVSSASRPDEASAAAAAAANEALLEALPRGAHPQEAMHEAILAAAAAVNALAPEVPGAQNAPACTLVGAVVSGGLLTIGWVGDSRAYWVPDDRAALPRRLTEDDSWAAQMVAAGLMGEAEAYADVRAHAITGWLGADAYDLEPHTATFKPDHDGVIVVCTDGLWNYAESARDMAQVLPADAAARPLHSAQVLVGHALDGGGHDNVTVAVVPFAAPEGPAPVQA
ncbi:protein phosphatase 2C domain-containing protein [Streptomyces sp. NBC_00503]|uniref:protein phosphatase 2C domain-containing protein n=1 Tax=Streptomyces sp. NBC_00503 TaxID=2903659 RepID=UPI002E820465|nr:protein phosphatase 2C domain-containing protein [Streptomyces sp. NBC_00503]WUD81381.1 protein phosphatase 2C domain-containing protein [Streptomyces sp. NBC_00503]